MAYKAMNENDATPLAIRYIIIRKKIYNCDGCSNKPKT